MRYAYIFSTNKYKSVSISQTFLTTKRLDATVQKCRNDMMDIRGFEDDRDGYKVETPVVLDGHTHGESSIIALNGGEGGGKQTSPRNPVRSKRSQPGHS